MREMKMRETNHIINHLEGKQGDEDEDPKDREED